MTKLTLNEWKWQKLKLKRLVLDFSQNKTIQSQNLKINEIRATIRMTYISFKWSTSQSFNQHLGKMTKMWNKIFPKTMYIDSWEVYTYYFRCTPPGAVSQN